MQEKSDKPLSRTPKKAAQPVGRGYIQEPTFRRRPERVRVLGHSLKDIGREEQSLGIDKCIFMPKMDCEFSSGTSFFGCRSGSLKFHAILTGSQNGKNCRFRMRLCIRTLQKYIVCIFFDDPFSFEVIFMFARYIIVLIGALLIMTAGSAAECYGSVTENGIVFNVCERSGGSSGYLEIYNSNNRDVKICYTLNFADGSDDYGCNSRLRAESTSKPSCYSCARSNSGGVQSIRLEKFEFR